MPEATAEIAQDLEQLIKEKLDKEAPINYEWEEGGTLHIEKPLPFLLVYRYQKGKADEVIKRMVSNESSHLIVEEKNEEIFPLIRLLTDSLSKKFGAFLILEIWSEQHFDLSEHPKFKIFGPGNKLPAAVRKVEKELKEMAFFVKQPTVELVTTKQRCRKGLRLLLTEAEWQKMECLYLGASVNKFYFNPVTGTNYPLLVRKFLVGVSKVLKQIIFDFVKVQTTQKITNYHVLGRRFLNKGVWEVDAKLVDISNQIDFLMLVAPVNSDEEWANFKKNKYRKSPVYHYRLLPVDPDRLKRQLYNIPIEKVEDPTMNFLFRDKRTEIEKMLTMLNGRETEGFLYNSLLLFGGVEPELLQVAEQILRRFPAESNEDCKWVSSELFAERAREEVRYLKQQWPELETRVEVNPNVIGLMVSQGVLYVGENSMVTEDRVEALIQHEVGTHVLTYFNGKAQPLQLLYSGVPGYEELQEGLAVLAEYMVGGLNAARLRKLAARVVAIHDLIKGEPFPAVYARLVDEYGFSPYSSYNVTMRAFRGGGLTKDAVYLKGLIDLLKYLAAGKPLEPLYVGKITEAYLPIIQELRLRKILKPTPLKPRYLSDPSVRDKINQLHQGMSVFDLVS